MLIKYRVGLLFVSLLLSGCNTVIDSCFSKDAQKLISKRIVEQSVELMNKKVMINMLDHLYFLLIKFDQY